jgi:uncharacterized protein YggE
MMEGRAISILSILSAFCVLAFALAGWAEPQAVTEPPRLVTATGDAEVRVVPDEVVLSLGVETWDMNLDIAKDQNDEIITKLLALTEEFGIPPEHVQTEFVSIEPRYRNGYYEESDFIGFFVRRTVVVTLRDLSRFEDLLAEALGAGVNYVHGIEFRTTELRKHRDQARALAIQAAREKAEAMAGQLGQKLGEPVSINEVQSGWWSSYGGWWGRSWGGAMAQNVIQELGGSGPTGDDSLAPGQINVNARVSVSFELAR